MIWKMHKNRKIRSLCLGLFLFACCLFFGCSSSLKASAAVVNVSSVNIQRSYFHSGIGSPTLQENAGSQNLPYSVLSYQDGYYKLLYNVIPSTYIGDNNLSSKYKTILVNLVFKQDDYNSSTNPLDYNSTAAFQITSHRNGESNLVTNTVCDLPEKTRTLVDPDDNRLHHNYMSITCRWQFSDYRGIDAFSVTVGSTDYTNIQQNYFQDDWAYVGLYDKIAPGSVGFNETLKLESVAYELKNTDDPLIAGQDLIIDINSNIYSNLQNMQAQDSQDRQDLSDQKIQNDIDATNAGNAATQANTPLFTAITSIYGSLLWPHQTNCVFGPVSVYQLNLGNLDFCTGFDIPQPLVAIGGLAMIGLVIGLCYAVLRSAVSLYREFLGGGK